MPNIIDEHKTIFIHIPKNAGTSILKAFGEDRAAHDKWYFFKKNYPEKWAAYFKFAVIRNPWDRVVSNYEYAVLNKSYWHSSCGDAIYGKHRDYDMLKEKSFEEAIWLLKNDFKSFKHAGWKAQHIFICNKQFIPQTNILRFENIEAEFNQLFPQLVLPKINQSRDNNAYRHYYTGNTIKLVEEIYKKDIELFKYSF
jgi:hypothetical protein